MSIALALCLMTMAPEAELLEDDITLPEDYEWSEILYDLQPGRPVAESAETWAPALEKGPKPPGFRTRAMLRGSSAPLPATDAIAGSVLAGRIRASVDGLHLAALTGKRNGSRDVLEVLAGGLEYSYRTGRIVAGDFELNSGQGLVFARSHARWLTPGLDRFAPVPLASLPGSPTENTLFEGVNWLQSVGPLNLAVFATRNLLSAVPNADSTIKSIVFDSPSDDSAALAGRVKLREDLAGARLDFSRPGLRASLCGYANRYGTEFRSDPASKGFAGSGLAVLSGDITCRMTDYVLQAEAAHTLGAGWAGALDLVGRWTQLSTDLELDYLQQSFFSPHSADRDLARAHDALDATFHARYRAGSWSLRLYGTTSRDFVLDSMPARVQLGAANQGTPFRFGVTWQQGFKDEASRTSGTRVDLAYDLVPGLELSGRLDDRFQFAQLGERGIAVSAGVGFRRDWLDLESKLTRFVVSNYNCRVYAYEPGFPGNNRSFSGTGWRWYLSGSAGFLNHFRVRGKLGATASTSTTFDVGLGLEASL